MAHAMRALQLKAAEWKRAATVCLLVFLFAFSQSAALLHNHDGDLNLKYDCEHCLKIGSSAGAIPSQFALPLVSFVTDYISLPGSDSPLLIVRSANARAPPAKTQS
jgi:hypothetical protein